MLTLPLIHALGRVDAAQRRRMVNIVKNRSNDSKAVAEVVEQVVLAGGIAHATERMYAHRDMALAELHHFPDNPARRSLEGLLHHTVERRK